GKPGRWLRLYRVTLANPQPAKPIRQMELVSANGNATLFFVAATLDPLAPGQRPDDSPDLEPTDPIPPQILDLTVQTSQGQAVPQAMVYPVIGQRLDKKVVSTKARKLITDALGNARVLFPSTGLEQLEITATHDEYAGRKMVWDLKAGDVIPSS